MQTPAPNALNFLSQRLAGPQVIEEVRNAHTVAEQNTQLMPQQALPSTGGVHPGWNPAAAREAALNADVRVSPAIVDQAQRGAINAMNAPRTDPRSQLPPAPQPDAINFLQQKMLGATTPHEQDKLRTGAMAAQAAAQREGR
jgi:hypothetical protein